mmetsp:Transcript_6584/g.16035  ORF Transcript_6584/g.16035 Transcript_6584/m.16035 type:complete len:150 (-) Transcript_6584:162-611(-)
MVLLIRHSHTLRCTRNCWSYGADTTEETTTRVATPRVIRREIGEDIAEIEEIKAIGVTKVEETTVMATKVSRGVNEIVTLVITGMETVATIVTNLAIKAVQTETTIGKMRNSCWVTTSVQTFETFLIPSLTALYMLSPIEICDTHWHIG